MLLIGVAMLAAATGASAGELKPVPALDLARYAGVWYEIARLPNPYQKQCARSVVVHYELRADGRLNVLNECVTGEGRLVQARGEARRAAPDRPPSQLKVRFAPAFLSFLPMVWADYWVIDLAPDYSWAVVGEPDRKFLWVLSRTPQMPQALYAEVLKRQEGYYDLSRLARTEQPAPAEATPPAR